MRKRHMFKKFLITSLIALGGLASNGNGPVVASATVDQEQRPLPLAQGPSSVLEPGEEFREEFHQTYPLSNTGRISLENINGGVQIRIWDRPAIQVDAIKRANRK